MEDNACSSIGRINIIKMTLYFKLFYELNTFPIRIVAMLFTEIDNLVLKYM